jgi:hypothetical protein
LSRDLRLARRWCDDLLVHSLEGCVQQGVLSRLRTFDWAQTAPPPPSAGVARGLRQVLEAILWGSAHPWPVLSVAAATIWALARRR